MMLHRQILSFFAALLLLGPAFAGEPVKNLPASDGKITFIGRTQVAGDSIRFDWAGVYARLKFQGSFLSVKVSDTKKNYYNVWLDGSMADEPDKVVATHGTDTTLVLFSAQEMRGRFGRKAAGTPHEVILQKRTEGEQGTTTFISFATDGDFLQAEGPKDRIIEYVGDSYTCGYGSENSVRTDPFTPETENQNKTYAAVAARYFGADHIILAHSGMGIARNYNDNSRDYYMPERYLQTFDKDRSPKWTPSADLQPDITVIYLGANDFSRSRQPSRRMFTDNYITLLKEIKAFYGENHPVLCVAPRNDSGMFDYIRAVQEACGLANVHVMCLSTSIHNDGDDLGASWHPNYKGHIKKAYAILPYISTITGWDLTGNPVR